ncbi:MAG: hypothetical protein AB8I58_13790 [Anaerolineales bacterium]
MAGMDKKQESNARSSVRGIASGVVFLAIFGVLWVAIGINGLQGLDEPWLLILMLLIGVALLVAGISLRRASQQYPKAKNPDGQRRNKWFLIVFATELITIVIANVICRAINRFDLFFPVMMLIVGIHFFPLAALFRVKKYYTTGVLLCLLAILTIFAVPERIRLNGMQINTWWVILGLGGAFILWGVGFANWIQGKRLLAQRKR